jgi:uncharacterized membrane protein
MSVHRRFLKKLKARKGTQERFGYGLKTADAYLADIAACGDDLCIEHLTGGKKIEDWKACLKRARSLASYSGADLKFEDFTTAAADFSSWMKANDAEGAEVPKNTLMVIRNVITTSSEDRDKDILHPDGAIVDPQMPFLWQHINTMPIGKMVKVLDKTKEVLRVVTALVDVNDFSKDVAVMIEAGMLRISHGFRVLEFEERKDGGFEITKFEIMEESGVSVPSNTDAVIEAFATRKWASPIIKRYAAAIVSQRPIQATGVTFKTPGGVEVAILDGSPRMSLTAAADAESTAKEEPGAGGGDTEVPSGDLPDLEKTERWNKRWSKSFDVTMEHLEPSKLEYDWVSRFLGCEVKQIYKTGCCVPAFRMGSFLTGLRHTMSEYDGIDTRNITYEGREVPPSYEVIELNSKQSDTFLVDGMTFFKGCNHNIVLKITPDYRGVHLTIYAAQKNQEEANGIWIKAWEWAHENNFLKGEAFALSGEFLAKTDEQWSDVFLDQENITAVKRSVKTINEKGKQAQNRGILMMGPPGTGKTLSGRIMRNEAEASFIWVSARDFYYMGAFGGLTAAFDLARELAPSILFVEDVDNWMSERTVDLVKTEMDGIGRHTGVVTALTTNYPERIPEALIDRPGRFHDVLQFGLPNKMIRHAMLSKWLPDANAADIEFAVKELDGYSGAHLREMCNLALSIQEDEDVPTGKALRKAIEKIQSQRELINDAQLAGSHHKPYRAAMTFTKVRTNGRAMEMDFTKAGRILSRKNEQNIRDALEDVNEIKKHDDATRPIKALAKSAAGSLATVLAAIDTDDPKSVTDAVQTIIDSKETDIENIAHVLLQIAAGRERDDANMELQELLAGSPS